MIPLILPQSMGFPATDWSGSLEAQRYYGYGQLWYWLSVHAGCPARPAATVRHLKGGIPLKLDKELVREILLAVEAHDEAQGWMELTIEGRTAKDVSYHVMLLDEAGLLSGISLGGMNIFEWQPKRLTYKGHEFLDTVRDPEVWRRTKEGAEKAGGAGLGILVEIGKAYGKQILKERLGLDIL